MAKPGRTELILTALVATVALGMIGSRLSSADADATAAPAEAGPAWMKLDSIYAVAHEMGPVAAPVRVIEFGNFLCEFCRAMYWTLDTITTRYPGLVSVRWIHHVEAGPEPGSGNRALAIASECAAEQGAFEQFYHAAFSAEVPIGTRRSILMLADSAEVPDTPRFLACLDSGKHGHTVDRHLRVAKDAAVSLTPTWYLNDQRILGALPLAEVDSLVLRVLGR